jgi:hypothetical protein
VRGIAEVGSPWLSLILNYISESVFLSTAERHVAVLVGANSVFKVDMHI